MKLELKKLATITILSFSLCLGLSSCSESDDDAIIVDDNETPIDLSANFSAIIDGTAFTPTSIIAIKQQDEENFTLTTLDDQDTSIQVLIDSSLNPGTYTFNEDIIGTVSMSSANIYAITDVSGVSGSLSILSHDRAAKKITGTFSFTSLDVTSQVEIVVSNGMFDVSYLVVE